MNKIIISVRDDSGMNVITSYFLNELRCISVTNEYIKLILMNHEPVIIELSKAHRIDFE